MDVTSTKNKTGFDWKAARADFPILAQEMNGRPLAFLDNAASSQKPQQVIDTLERYYQETHANIHRAVYQLSQRATEAYEQARIKAQRFLNARSDKEIIFVRGATEGINLVANSYGRKYIGQGDEIILTEMEHHANIVPWQMLCQQTGAKLKIAPVKDDGALDMEAFRDLFNERTKFAAVVHISNTLGTINPLEEMIDIAHRHDVPILVDGAQAAPHLRVDVQALDCDFYTFSGHKTFGPTGIGVLYGKEALLEDMPPYQGGGDMIRSVTFEKTTYNELPYKFEAGTPNIADAIGLGAAIDYLNNLDIDQMGAYENELLHYGTEKLEAIEGLRIIGTAPNKTSVISFDVDGVHPHDVGQFLDFDGIAVRTGHHCTQPLMDRFNVPATTRASFAFYNNKEEIDRLAESIQKVIAMFKR